MTGSAGYEKSEGNNMAASSIFILCRAHGNIRGFFFKIAKNQKSMPKAV